MKRKALDNLDKALIACLTKEGRMPIQKLGQTLNITTPTVRSRLNALIDSKSLQVSGLIDPSKVDGLITALIGISLDTTRDLDEKLEKIADLEQVSWAAAVTGSYDVIAEVVSSSGMNGIYSFLSESLVEVGGIKSTETFLVMRAKRKWMRLPAGIEKDWTSQGKKGSKS
ncbi:MAG: Lrp/AsnC family transcriptional regulator [Desulfarculaceae bacterium]|jgi:Lrp/AsnC family transcriptional regulator for asnA, asnC and gidA